LQNFCSVLACSVDQRDEDWRGGFVVELYSVAACHDLLRPSSSRNNKPNNPISTLVKVRGISPPLIYLYKIGESKT
jgi:hypothetical protein